MVEQHILLHFNIYMCPNKCMKRCIITVSENIENSQVKMMRSITSNQLD